jgi:hypothetical protein
VLIRSKLRDGKRIVCLMEELKSCRRMEVNIYARLASAISFACRPRPRDPFVPDPLRTLLKVNLYCHDSRDQFALPLKLSLPSR